jgi:hypothetical protein
MGVVYAIVGQKIRLLQGGSFDLSIPMTLSRFTGDLAASSSMLFSPQVIFEKYGIGKLFPYIRLQILRFIEEAILLDKIPVKQDAFQTTFTLRVNELTPNTSAEDERVVGLLEASDALELVMAPVEEVSQSLEELNREREPELRERRAKAERLRTVHYRKAVSALGRLGVTLEPGGRHMKARYGEKTAAFPNSHSGKNSDITYILRSVLEILGISEEDFIREL